MTWVRRTFWEPDNVDPGQLPFAIVCPPRNWGMVHAEIEAENPPYPVVLFRPLHRCAGWSLRGYEYRHISNEEYESEAVHQWEHVELNPRVVRPAPSENHYDHTHFTIVDDLPDPSPTTEAMRERMNDWVDRVFREETERREQATVGILSAIDTSNVAESSDDELTEETFREAIRELRMQSYRPDEIPEWQVQIIQAMMEGRTLIASRGRGHGLRQIFEWLTEFGLAGNARIFEVDIVPENQVMIGDGPDDDIVMASWFAEQGSAERIRELYANTPPESPFLSMAELAERRRQERQAALARDEQVPDEITDADRERWANELETTPMPDVGQDSGGGLSSDELLEAIGEAVDEWKGVRDA